MSGVCWAYLRNTDLFYVTQLYSVTQSPFVLERRRSLRVIWLTVKNLNSFIYQRSMLSKHKQQVGSQPPGDFSFYVKVISSVFSSVKSVDDLVHLVQGMKLSLCWRNPKDSENKTCSQRWPPHTIQCSFPMSPNSVFCKQAEALAENCTFCPFYF